MERLVFNKLFDFVTENKILSDFQFGFRSHHSCNDALIAILHKIYEKLNKQEKVCLVTLDIKKAFDSVDHRILLSKLKRIGCDNCSLEWFKSYLCERKQFILNGEEISKTLDVKSGVPQGSVLGSLLFSIFINDLTDIEINGDLYLYCDDSSLICSAKDLTTLESKINSALISINEWILSNNLRLNNDKSNYMLINLSNREFSELNININGNKIQKVIKTKILGIIFDQNLHFIEHIKYICEKTIRKVNLLKRLKYFLPIKTLNTIYKSLIQSQIDYGITIYGFTYESNINRIFSLQKRAAKIIIPTESDFKSILKTLKWIDFNKRKHFFSSIFIYRCLNNLSPNICKPFFKKKSSNYSTRSQNNQELDLPFSRLSIFQKTIFYSGIVFYNNLDLNIRNICNFKAFKRKLKEYISI